MTMTAFAFIYDPVTGATVGRVGGTNEAEIVNRYPHRVMLTEEEYQDDPEIKKKYNMGTGQLEDKGEVVITSSASEFIANGVDSVTLTFTGLIADGTVKVGPDDLPITVADPEIILTSDTPRMFNIKMKDDIHWSEQIQVKAN